MTVRLEAEDLIQTALAVVVEASRRSAAPTTHTLVLVARSPPPPTAAGGAGASASSAEDGCQAARAPRAGPPRDDVGAPMARRTQRVPAKPGGPDCGLGSTPRGSIATRTNWRRKVRMFDPLLGGNSDN